jgi:hypothetical protein
LALRLEGEFTPAFSADMVRPRAALVQVQKPLLPWVGSLKADGCSSTIFRANTAKEQQNRNY